MLRFPPIPPSQQTPEQKQAQNELESLGPVFGKALTAKDHDGTMIGPFVPLLYTPEISQPFVSLAAVIPTLPHLTPRVRELAILATASTYDAPFILYAHSRIAQSVGLSPGQIADASVGKTPAGLDAVEEAAWAFSRRLAGTRGPLDTATWQNAQSCLGREGVANLAHVTGAYAYLSMFQNAADIRLPGGENLEGYHM